MSDLLVEVMSEVDKRAKTGGLPPSNTWMSVPGHVITDEQVVVGIRLIRLAVGLNEFNDH